MLTTLASKRDLGRFYLGRLVRFQKVLEVVDSKKDSPNAIRARKITVKAIFSTWLDLRDLGMQPEADRVLRKKEEVVVW